jgi:hypothetical protein
MSRIEIKLPPELFSDQSVEHPNRRTCQTDRVSGMITFSPQLLALKEPEKQWAG